MRTHPKTNSSHLKHWGWLRWVFFWGPRHFGRCELLVFGSVCVLHRFFTWVLISLQTSVSKTQKKHRVSHKSHLSDITLLKLPVCLQMFFFCFNFHFFWDALTKLRRFFSPSRWRDLLLFSSAFCPERFTGPFEKRSVNPGKPCQMNPETFPTPNAPESHDDWKTILSFWGPA